MTVELLKPVLADRTRSINFFNGRLLTGDDLTAEQKANRVAHTLLGQAVGDGVVYGLEVSVSAQSSLIQSPVLAVTHGLAINRKGTALLLDSDTEVTLVRPSDPTNGSRSFTTFQDCEPTQTGTYIAGAGVYLLTVGPATATEGLAEVSGIRTAQAPCNSKYNAQGVQFRLIQLDLSLAELNDTNHLRNLVAYKCFGVAEQAAFVTNPFGPPPTSYGLMDQLRAKQSLTDCEVPLAVLYWTATSGIVFVDMWSVQRHITQRGTSEQWPLFADERPCAEAVARLLQFQNHLYALAASSASPQTIVANDHFRYLPAAGLLPAWNGVASQGFDYLRFFSSATYRSPVFVEGARLRMILRQSLLYSPIDLDSGELLWLYLVRENRQLPPTGSVNTAQPYILFVTGHAPYYGDAHYQVARWNYSNYS